MRSGWMHVAGFEGQEKFAPKTLAEQVYVNEGKNILELLNENSNVDDEAIRKIVASSVVFSNEILGESVWDNDNLFSTKIVQSNGNIFWIDEGAEVYSITRAEGSIELRSNQSLQGKRLNIISIKNSDMLVFIGLSQKKDILIYTNIANQSRLIGKALQDGTVVFKADRVECRPQSVSRKLISTKAIDLSNYSRARMYGKLYWEYQYGDAFTAYFGALKNEAVNNPNVLNPNNAFTAMTRLTGLDENNFLEVDISQLNGPHHIGAFGIASWDTFRFELLR